MPGKTPLNEGLYELSGIEDLKVLHALAHPDEPDGYLKLPGYGDDYAALGRAVELCEHDAGHAHCLVKHARLRKGVLSGGGVEHQQVLVRRVGDLPCSHLLDLLELLHKVALGMEP